MTILPVLTEKSESENLMASSHEYRFPLNLLMLLPLVITNFGNLQSQNKNSRRKRRVFLETSNPTRCRKHNQNAAAYLVISCIIVKVRVDRFRLVGLIFYILWGTGKSYFGLEGAIYACRRQDAQYPWQQQQQSNTKHVA